MDKVLLVGGWIFIGVAALVIAFVMYKVLKKKPLSKKERFYPFILFGAGFLYVIALAFTYAKPGISLSDQIQILIQFGLVTVTCFYAWSAQRQAEANVTMAKATAKQAEIALNGQNNATAPVIDLAVSGSRTLEITCKNVGMGPALNFRCWIEDKEFSELKWVCKQLCHTALAKDEILISKPPIDTKIDGYTLNEGRGTNRCLRAQYESVFRKTYETCLHSSMNAAPEISYFEVVNDKDIVII